VQSQAGSSHLAQIFELVWPAILQGLLITVVFITDRALLGHFSADGLSVMQICGPVLWSLFSVCGVLDVGALAMIGRAVGARDEERARQLLSAGLWAAFGVGVLLSLSTPWVAQLTIEGFGREAPHLHQISIAYLSPVLWFAPFKMIGGLCSAALQSGGDTRTPMWISLICGVVNLLLSAGLIYGWGGLPQWGIVGASWGSVAAFSLQGILGLIVMTQRQGIPNLTSVIWPQWRALSPMLTIAGGVFIERLGYHIAFLVFSSLISGLGVAAMGAHQVVLAVESIGFICADAFGIAGSALVAQQLGAEKKRDAQQIGWLNVLVSGAMLSILSVLFLFYPEALIRMISNDPEVIRVGVPCLQVSAIAQPLMAMTCALAGGLRGAGDTRNPIIAILIGPVAVRLFFCWLLAYHWGWGLIGIWVGSTLDWVARVIFLSWVFRRGRWVH
jgi:putative MATE family efflux protein